MPPAHGLNCQWGRTVNIAVCFNLVPGNASRGEVIDRIAEQGAEHEARAVPRP